MVVRFAARRAQGVAGPRGLAVHVLGEDRKTVAGLERVLWILPEDPFSGHGKRLKGYLEITLFDPARTTAAVLTKAGVPFEEQNNLSSLADLRKGLVVIGKEPRSRRTVLAAIMLKLVARGLPVRTRWAPSEGTFALPRVGEADKTGLEGLTLRRRL